MANGLLEMQSRPYRTSNLFDIPVDEGTRFSLLPFGQRGGEFSFAVPQMALDAAEAAYGVADIGKRTLFDGEAVTEGEMLDAAMQYGENFAGPQAVGSVLTKPDPSTLSMFAGPRARNFPAYKDIDQTILNALKSQYENASNRDEMKLAIAEYEKELASVNAAKRQALNEAESLLADSLSPAGAFSASERKYGTGLFKLPDANLRFEIDDRDAKVVFPGVESDKVTGRLPNFPGEIRFTDEFSKQVFNKEFNLADVFKHPELYKNYPQFKDIKIQFTNDPDGAGGSFNPNLNRITVNLSPFKDIQKDELSADLLGDRVADILVHEVQHSVQEVENFARGGNLSLARIAGIEEQEKARGTLRDTAFSEKIYNQSRSELFDISDAKSIQSYQEMSKRDSFQPRQIKRTSDWYKYGDRIRNELFNELGYAEPKKKGPKRDYWYKAAFAKMASMARDDNPTAGLLAEKFNKKELDKQSRDLSKKMKPEFADTLRNRSARNVMDEFYPGGSFYDFEDNMMSRHNIYENLLGEAEARAVQARRGPTIAGNAPGLLYNHPVYLEYPRQAFPFNQFERGSMKSPPPLGLLETFVRLD